MTDGDGEADDGDVSMASKEDRERGEAREAERQKLARLREEKRRIAMDKKRMEEERKVFQMYLIENEQVSLERLRRLKSERYNHEFDRTSPDISSLQVMLKQLCQQRQGDVYK